MVQCNYWMSGDDMEKKYRLYRLDNDEVPENDIGELKERPSIIVESFGGLKVVKVLDYSKGLDGLPKSDVMKFLLEGNCSVVVRPSGTEPKLKTYISVSAESVDEARNTETRIMENLKKMVI